MNTIKYLKDKKFTGLDDIKEVRSELYKKRITVSYEPNIRDGKRRVIFSCSKTIKTQTFDEICLDCNGLILEAPEWKPLCIPLPSSKNNINTTKINGYIKQDKYDFYQIEDGTIINLYFYENKWIIATSRGYDMNSVKFNSLSYQELLEDCIIKSNISLQEFYNSLDQNRCYTFGFKHPDIHPFWAGKDPICKVWFIRSVTLNNLGTLETISVDNTPPLENIPAQKKITLGVKNMNFIYKKLKNAYENYTKTGHVNYGYILADKNVNTLGDDSMIILESTLMNTIRNLWYNGAYIKFSETHKFDRINLILLHAFLDDNRSEKFLTLFPQYSEAFIQFSKIENDIVSKIYEEIKNNSDNKSSLLYPMIQSINSILTVTLHENPCKKIKDIIHSNEYIQHYYNIIYLSNTSIQSITETSDCIEVNCSIDSLA